MPVQWPESRHVRVLPPAEVPSHRDTRPEIRLRPGIISQRTNSPPPRLRDDGKHYYIERRQLTKEEEVWSAVLCRRPRFLAAAMELRGAHSSLTRFSAEADVEERFLIDASAHDPSMWDACLLDAPHHTSAFSRALHQRPEAQVYSIRSLEDERVVGFLCVAENSPGDLRTGIDILVLPFLYLRHYVN